MYIQTKMSGLTFEQVKNLVQTDFFDIDQIKAIALALKNHEPIKLKLSQEQLKQLANISQLDD